MTYPVVAAHVDPSFPSGRLLWPGAATHRPALFLYCAVTETSPDSPNSRFLTAAIRHVGSDVGSNAVCPWISKPEHLVRAMFCAPGRNRTYDRQIRRLLLYPLSYGGRERAVRTGTASSRITVAPDLAPNKSIGSCSPPGGFGRVADVGGGERSSSGCGDRARSQCLATHRGFCVWANNPGGGRPGRNPPDGGSLGARTRRQRGDRGAHRRADWSRAVDWRSSCRCTGGPNRGATSLDCGLHR